MRILNQLVSSRSNTFSGTNPVEYITVHETGNTSVGADAQAHANLQSGGNARNASWHTQVDDKVAINSFTKDVKCWHAGDGSGYGNTRSRALEICVNSDGDYEKALDNAAAVIRQWRAEDNIPRSRVVQHNHWSGKNCPAGLRSSGRWDSFVASTDPEGASSMSTFVSPVKGRVSSNWGARVHPITRARGFHRGIDIAAPVGTPIRAAYGGTVRATSMSLNLRGNKITGTWNSGRFVLIDGPGGGSEWYGHVNTIRVKPGQRVKAGQIIATVGATGNVTGPHLHLEMWNGRYQGGGSGRGNTRDPRADFRKYGVSPGAAGSGGTGGAVKPAPAPKPKKKKKQAGYSKYVENRQKILAGMGYYHGAIDGIAGPVFKKGVLAYQRAQVYSPGLKADGVWGPATEAHYRWTKKLQKAMNRWKGRKVPVDGDNGNNTRKRVGEVMRRNRRRAYRGKIDRIPGPVFCKMLGIRRHPGLK